MTPVNGSPDIVFADVPLPLRLYCYQDGQFVSSGDPAFPSIQAGQGYWIYLEGKTRISVTGNLINPAAQASVLLHPGWNQVACPWGWPYDWEDGQISIYNGTDTLSLTQAEIQGWIEGDLHDYQTASGTYSKIEPNAMVNGQMQPWKGYLLYSNIDALLQFTPPGPDQQILFGNLVSPKEGDVLEGPTAIIGSVIGLNLMQYSLEYAPAGSDDFTVFTIGTENVENATLGTFDPTILMNGAYTLRLSAVDLRGLDANISIGVVVRGNQKVGQMGLSLRDFSIPLPGLNLEIIRKYDSRDKRKGPFGYGWTMEMTDARIDANGPIGTGWTALKQGNSYGVDPERAHVVTVTLPEGEVHYFLATLSPSRWAFYEPLGTFVVFTPLPGSKGTLTPVGGNAVNFSGVFPGPMALVDAAFQPFDPERYVYTTRDGIRMTINRLSGLESISDLNGNTLTFTENGITHSSGRGVDFDKDEEGRMESIADLAGNTVQYEYDARGDLVAVTDRMGNTSRYAYDYRHNMTGLTDAMGNILMRTEYDDEGRIVAQIDSDGNRIEYDHRLGDRQEVIKDRLGNQSVIHYDEAGNILLQTDPLGNSTFYTYDTEGNLTSETDPLGNTTQYTYDTSGNRTSKTDPEGNTTLYTYNSRGQRTSLTDPAGNTTELDYDEQGNLIETRMPDGSLTQYEYNSAGLKTKEVNALGHVTRFEYDGDGHPVRETDPLGNVTERDYNVMGLVECVTQTRTTDSGIETLIARMEYNAEGKMTRAIDPLGQETRYEYDTLNRETARILPGGRRTETVYDSRGNTIKTIQPDGSVKESKYDAEGQITEEVDEAGRITRYEFDKAGQPTKQITPSGGVIARQYDNAGRLLAFQLPNGASMEYDINGADRQTALSNLYGDKLERHFNAAGKIDSVTDPLGRVTQYIHDKMGRQTATIHVDGASESTEYDLLGRKTAEIDPLGNRSEYAYDAAGQVIAITDALGYVTRYRYDEIGNLLETIDALGRSTRMTYDKIGRLLSRSLPLGMTETYTYGSCCNNPVSHTDFAGRVFTFEHDSMNRLIARTLPGGATQAYNYNSIGNRTSVSDATGVTRYDYDSNQALTRIVNPDGAEISYAYDTIGNRIRLAHPAGAVHYEYDSANRLAKIVDSASGETLFERDTFGSVTRIVRPNGVTTEFAYDPHHRPVQVVHRKQGGALLSSFDYTLDAAGNRIRVVEDTGRTVDYTYDATYKLTGETIHDPTDGELIVTYEYDGVGNRLRRTVNGVETNYTYDANDRLIEEETSTTVGQVLLDEDERQGLAASLHTSHSTVSLFGLLYIAGAAAAIRALSRGRRFNDPTGRRKRLSGAIILLTLPFLVLGPEAVPDMQSVERQNAAMTRSLGETIVYTYDANGNLTSKSNGTDTTYYNYNLDDQLIRIDENGSTIQYSYNCQGLRTEQDVDGEIKRFLYDTGRDLPRVLEERSSTGALECAYLWGDSLDPIAMERQGQRSYYLTDGILNVRQLVNASGQITDRYNLDAFGNVLSRTGSTPNQYLLHGQYYDPNAGFYYMRARWMNPELGGFTSLDPVFGDPMNPVTLHKYLFAAGNPLTYMDPTGHNISTAITTMVIIAVIGIFIGVVAMLLGLIHYVIGLFVGFIEWQGGTASLTGSVPMGFVGFGMSYVYLESECWTPHKAREKKQGKGDFLLFFWGLDQGLTFIGFNFSDLVMHTPTYWGNYPPVPLSGVVLLAGFTAAAYGGFSIGEFVMGSGLMDSGSIITIGAPSLHGVPGGGFMAGAGVSFLGGFSLPATWYHDDC